MEPKLKRHVFRLLHALKSSPLAQQHAAEFVQGCTGIKPRVLLKEAEATALKDAESGDGASTVDEAVEGIAFFPPDRYFIRRLDGRGWEERRENAILRVLHDRGVSKSAVAGRLSADQAAILHIQSHRSVDYAGPQTAFPPGIHQHGNLRFLVTEGIEFIEPRQGNPEPFLEVLRTVCGVGIDPNGHDQFALVCGWTKQWRQALRTYGQHIPGQTLGIGGDKNAGKNLVSGLLSMLGGNRAYDPHRNFTGDDKFNGELLTCVLAASHDPKFKNDEAARLFWQSQKELVANREHSIRAMWSGARTLPLAGVRGLITFNLAPESSKILPPVLLEDGTADKVILIRAHSPAMPYPALGTSENAVWYSGLKASLPAVAWYLDNEFTVPPHLADARFGVRGFCAPEIRAIIDGNHADAPLGELLDLWFGSIGGSNPMQGAAAEIYSTLIQTHEPTLRAVTRSPIHLGHQLRRLRELDGWRQRITATEERIPPNNQRRTVWRIAPPTT